MKMFRFLLILGANFVVTIVAYYGQCYDAFSLCLITNIEDFNDQYRWNNKNRLDQSSAAYWCKEKSSSLAIITNETVQAAIEAFINDPCSKLTSDVITYGYRFGAHEWMWISGRQSAIYPNGYVTDGYRYAYLSVSEGGIDVTFLGTANFKKKFICSYVHRDFSCLNDYQQLGIRCYKIRNEAVTWFEARNLCLQEDGSDLATFEDGIPSQTPVRWPHDEYWIGLRRERWYWRHEQTASSDMKYSNWDDNRPSAIIGDCLCVRIRTGKWTNCDCSQTYRYICVQAYSSNMSSSAPTTTTTTTITTTVRKASTTLSTTLNTILTEGDPPSELYSTQAQELDDNHKASGVILALGIGAACVLLLIRIIVAIVVTKNRRSRSGGVGPRQQDSPPQNFYEAGASNNVYAIFVPNTNEPNRSPSERIQSEIVNAELDLAPAEKMIQRASAPGKTPKQVVHDPAPKRSKRGRSAAPESEYDNSIPLESVYDNIAPS